MMDKEWCERGVKGMAETAETVEKTSRETLEFKYRQTFHPLMQSILFWKLSLEMDL